MNKQYPQRYNDTAEILRINGWEPSKSSCKSCYEHIIWEKKDYPYQINFLIQSSICDISVSLKKGKAFLQTDFFPIGTCYYEKEANILTFGDTEESSEKAITITL